MHSPFSKRVDLLGVEVGDSHRCVSAVWPLRSQILRFVA